MQNSILKISLVSCIILLFSCSEDLDEKKLVKVGLKKVEEKNPCVSQIEAVDIAADFIKAQQLFPMTRSEMSLEMVYAEFGSREKPATRSSEDKNATFYVVNVGELGYIIVSGSAVTYPVLGYSNDGVFNKDSMPANMKKFLASYNDEILLIRKQNIKVTPQIEAMRESYLQPAPLTRAAADGVLPLLGEIKWDQRPFYNALCPKKCPLGCVATATAQIMKYWEYPDQGVGTYTYPSFTYGDLSFDYNYKLNWDKMPKEKLSEENEDIAKLCYGVAVGLSMRFEKDASYAAHTSVPYLLTEHYTYASSAHIENRADYASYKDWTDMLKKELDLSRPIQYRGMSEKAYSAHSFVCDGYDSKGYFHFNWGWGGKFNGYFMLDALNPEVGEPGSTDTGYNKSQNVVIGIQPPNQDYGEYPETKGLDNSSAFIRRVEVANLNSKTSKEIGGYNYFEKEKVTLVSGESYIIEMVGGETYNGIEEIKYWQACIDYNGDNLFTTDEIIAKGMSRGGDGLILKFKVPTQISKKKNVRMRVSLKHEDYPKTNEIFAEGEVEDYNVEILPKKSLIKEEYGTYPQTKGTYNKSTFIAKVKLANIESLSGSEKNGYNHFTNQTVQLTKGNSYTIQLTPGFLDKAYVEYWQVCIDFDGDSRFTTDEIVARGVTNGMQTLTSRFKVPENAKKGMRMRVSMKWGGYPLSTETFLYGEVEDYNVEISNPGASPVLNDYPQARGVHNRTTYIESIKLANMINQTKSEKNGYNYFEDKVILLNAGEKYKIELVPGFFEDSYEEYWQACIDFNGDKEFTVNEIVAKGITKGKESFVQEFVVPQNVKMENGTRMRVMMKWGGYAKTSETFTHGEVEDYKVIIQ